MKIFYPFAFICLLCFYACKKNSDNGSPTIVGKWTHVSSIWIKTVNGVDSLTRLGINANEYIQFNKDETGYSSFGIPYEAGAHFAYRIVNDSLVTDLAGNPNRFFKIKTLNSNILILRLPIIPTIAREDYYTK